MQVRLASMDERVPRAATSMAANGHSAEHLCSTHNIRNCKWRGHLHKGPSHRHLQAAPSMVVHLASPIHTRCPVLTTWQLPSELTLLAHSDHWIPPTSMAHQRTPSSSRSREGAAAQQQLKACRLCPKRPGAPDTLQPLHLAQSSSRRAGRGASAAGLHHWCAVLFVRHDRLA